MRVVAAKEHAVGADVGLEPLQVVLVVGRHGDVPAELLHGIAGEASGHLAVDLLERREQRPYPGAAAFDGGDAHARVPFEHAVAHQRSQGVADRCG